MDDKEVMTEMIYELHDEVEELGEQLTAMLERVEKAKRVLGAYSTEALDDGNLGALVDEVRDRLNGTA